MKVSTAACRAEFRSLRRQALALHSQPFGPADFDAMVCSMVPVGARPVEFVQAAGEYLELIAVANQHRGTEFEV